MKTTLQALCLILFVILFHLIIISSFGLVVWLGLCVSAAVVFIWLCQGASYAQA